MSNVGRMCFDAVKTLVLNFFRSDDQMKRLTHPQSAAYISVARWCLIRNGSCLSILTHHVPLLFSHKVSIYSYLKEDILTTPVIPPRRVKNRNFKNTQNFMLYLRGKGVCGIYNLFDEVSKRMPSAFRLQLEKQSEIAHQIA